jgi:hypothetical protein
MDVRRMQQVPAWHALLGKARKAVKRELPARGVQRAFGETRVVRPHQEKTSHARGLAAKF